MQFVITAKMVKKASNVQRCRLMKAIIKGMAKYKK